MRTSDTGNSLPGSGKTILVLDDEPDVRKLITTTLTSDGYRVLTADNGESAIKAFKKSRQPVDLALLDVVSRYERPYGGRPYRGTGAEIAHTVHVGLRRHHRGTAVRRGQGLRPVTEAV